MNGVQRIDARKEPWGMDEDGEFLVNLVFDIVVAVKCPAEFIEIDIVLTPPEEDPN